MLYALPPTFKPVLQQIDTVRWSYSLHRYYVNRPFYRYGGHIEVIQFKEYYRMPPEHEHISFVFSSAFRDIFS